MEVITLAVAQAMAKVALDKFVEGGASELGKKLTEPIAQKVMKLGTIIWDRIKGNATAVAALEGAAQNQTEDIQKLKNYLYSLWKDEQSEFTTEVKNLADEIHFELAQAEENSIQIQNNYAGTNSQNRISGGNVYQAASITINEAVKND
jgi:hypothetical protein